MDNLINFVFESRVFLFLAFTLVALGFIEFTNKQDIKVKKILVLLASVSLMAYLDFYSFLIMSVCAGLVFAMARKQLSPHRKIYPLSLVLIGFLIVIKDYHIFFSLENYYLPLGISYYFFRLISFVIDYSKDIQKYKDIKVIDFFSWVYFFPIFLAGPIQRYNSFSAKEFSKAERDKFYGALLLGVCIKLTLVDNVLYPFGYQYLKQHTTLDVLPGFLASSLFGFVCFIHAYIDLFLYTLISQSVSGLLGFSYVHNFDKPHLATNISEFWNKYHISLSSWTRDYIFFPTLIKTKKAWLSTYASMFVMGIWHSATWNWVTWSICHATLINIYSTFKRSQWYKKLTREAWQRSVLGLLGNVFTLYFVGIIFIFVAIPDYKEAVRIFLKLFGQ